MVVLRRLLAMLALAAGLAAADGAATAAGARTAIIAAIPEDFPPTYFRDPATGRAAGFAVAVMDEVARRAGLEVTYVFGKPWDELHRLVLEGHADVLPGLVVNEERMQRFIFTGAMESIAISFVARASQPDDAQPGTGARIGVIRGSAADELAMRRPELTPVRFDSLQHLLMELLAGRLDFALCPEQNVRKLAAEAGVDDRIRVLRPPAQEGRRAIALRCDDAALRDRLDRALAEFLGTPQYQALFSRWWGHPPPFWNGTRVLLAASGAVGATLALLLLLHYRGVRRSAAALRAIHLRREAIFHGARDAMMVAELDSGLLIEANRAAEALFGRPRAAFVGMHHTGLHPPDLHPQLAREFGRHLGGSAVEVATEILHADGTRIPVEINGAVVVLPDGVRVVVGCFRDMRQQVRLEEQLRQSEKLTAIGQLAGGIAHDFNNQLAGIQGYAELLVHRLNGEERRYAENIQLAAQRSAELTGQLLAFARKGKSLSVPVDLHRTVAEVVGLLNHTIDRRIAIRQDLQPGAATVLGDPGQLQAMLLNLAINARDALEGRKGGELRFATAGADLPPNHHGCGNAAGAFVALRVSDNGCGMDAAVLRRVFEPFFTTKPAGRGTGLGLSAAYGVVRSHGGAIAVESAPGLGSTFTVWLPRQAGDAPPAAPISAGGGTGRILVVDDEAVVRTMTADLVAELGYQSDACGDVHEAVERLRAAGATGYAAVMLDLVMPGLGGLDAFRLLREAAPGLRVLLVSGHSRNEEVQALLDDGAAGFLQKPFTIAALGEALAAVRRSA